MGAIYRITHKASGTTYVGSTGNVERRRKIHESALRRGKHNNPRLQYAYNKYGADAFEWAVLEEGVANKDLAEREQYWLDEYKGRGEVYNYGECISNARRGRPLTEAHKQRISEANMGHHRCLGQRRTEETKRKMSAAKMGNQGGLGHVCSVAERRKIGRANAGPYPAFIHRETGEIIPAGINLSKLCRERGLSRWNMWAVAHGRAISCRGWTLLEKETR